MGITRRVVGLCVGIVWMVSSVPPATAGDLGVDVSVEISESTDPVGAGPPADTLTYVITARNNGRDPATGVTFAVTLTLPANVSLSGTIPSGSTSFDGSTWTIGGLADSAEETLTFVITTTASANLGDEILLTALLSNVDQTDDLPGNNAAAETTTIGNPVDLEVTIEESVNPVLPGEMVTVTVTVTNNGPLDTSGVTLDVSVPSGPAGISVTQTTPSAGTTFADPLWTVGDLDNGNSETLTFEVTVDGGVAEGSTVTTGAMVTAFDGTQTDSDPGNNTAESIVSVNGRVDLSLEIAESIDPVVAGSGVGNLVYTVTLSNAGPSTATGIQVRPNFNLPFGVSLESLVPSAGEAAEVWDLPSLSSGASETLTVNITVAGPAQSGVDTVGLDVAVEAVDQTEADTTDDVAMESTSVQGGEQVPPEISQVTVTLDGGSVALGTCGDVRQVPTGLSVTFNEAMDEPAAGQVVHYQLVSAGADGDLASTSCSVLDEGDDSLALASVDYDAKTFTTALDVSALADGQWVRLLVCDTIFDAAGNFFAGEFRDLRIDSTNLLTNGEFDCDLGSWDAVPAASPDVLHDPDDSGGKAASGSVRWMDIDGSGLGLDQCIDLGASTSGLALEISGAFRIEGGVGEQVGFGVQCEFFDGAGCGGSSLGSFTAPAEVISTTLDGWDTFTHGFSPAASTASIDCRLDAVNVDGGAPDLFLDALRLEVTQFFGDGFESGDTTQWSLAVP